MNLKKCPFCGADAKMVEETIPLPTGQYDTLYYIVCILRECGCRTMSWYPKSTAMFSWNRRTKKESP